MLSHLRPAAVMIAVLTLLTGVVYPLVVTGIGQMLFPSAANGSLLRNGDAVIGSELIGQGWTSDKYFRGRPSAAGAGYDAAASSGSNLAPTSKKLMERIAADAERLRPSQGAGLLPADAVTASASGLDPHISPDFAVAQVERVAKARGLRDEQVRAAVNAAIEKPLAGVLGEPRVNVLLLNMALDRLSSAPNG